MRRCLAPSTVQEEHDDLIAALAASLQELQLCAAEEPEPEVAAAAAADSASSAGAVSGPAAAPGPWAYAVWSLSGRDDLRGVHTGGSVAWTFLLDQLPGKVYSTATIRCRRAPSAQEAAELYACEAVRHRAPLPPRTFAH